MLTELCVVCVCPRVLPQQKFTEAEPLYRGALRIDEEADPDHPNVASSLNNLAALMRDMVPPPLTRFLFCCLFVFGHECWQIDIFLANALSFAFFLKIKSESSKNLAKSSSLSSTFFDVR